MGRLQIVKKLSGALFIAALLSFSVVASLLTPHTALAAGATYQWSGPNTITATGGNYVGTITFTKGSVTVAGNGQIIGTGFVCNAQFYIVLNGNNAGTLQAFYPGSSNSSTGYCQFTGITSDGQAAAAAAIAALNGSHISISGAPSGNGQKQNVHLVVYGDRVKSPPASLTISIKNSSNKTVISQKVNVRPGQPWYVLDTSLLPGKYTACADKIVTYCTTFDVIIQSQTLNVNMNDPVEGAVEQVVNAVVIYTFNTHDICSLKGTSVGPLSLTLSTQDSNTTLQTATTESKFVDGLGCDGLSNDSHEWDFNTQFKNVTPGKYKVCLHGTQLCTSFTKVEHVVPTVKITSVTLGDIQQGVASGESPSCETSGFSLSWIMCPIINGLADAADGIYAKVVKPLLVTRTIDVNNTNDQTSQAIFKVWSVFRVLGDIFLAIALLILVFGESIGGGMVDAYTVKKVLPRLLIAAVLINLSIYVASAMVDITNIIGGGIIRLITAPFGQTGNFDITMNGTTSGLGLAAMLTGIGALWIGAGALLEFLLAFVLLPALFIVISVMVVVLLRRGLIILLVMMSPVAFALYCLPNTEQYFRKFMDLFVKTLLVYPIVAALFGIAKVLSVTIGWGGGTSGPVSTFAQILSIIALFVPLALIPFAFKIAGGFLGRVHELASGFGKRSHQAMLGNPNDGNSWRNRAKRKNAARFAEKDLSGTAIKTRLNPTTLVGSRRQLRTARLGATRNMLQAVYGKQGMGAAMYEANKDDSNITGDIAKYATGEQSRAAAKADLDAGKIDQATYQQRLFSSASADRIGRDPAMRRRALMNPATIGYEIGTGEEGWNEATTIMRSIAGEDEGLYRSMVNEFQYVAKSAAGRTDLAAAVDGGDYNGYKAWTQLGMYQHGGGKPRAIAGSAKYFNGLMDRTRNPQNLTSQDIDNFTSHLTDQQKATMSDTEKRAVAHERAQDAVAIFTKELGNMGDGATGSVRDEAVKQRDILLERGGPELAQRMQTERVISTARGYDRDDMQRRAARGDL